MEYRGLKYSEQDCLNGCYHFLNIYIQHKGGKVDFSPFDSGVYVHPPQTYFPRLLIDYKNSGKWLTYFSILLCITTHLLFFLSWLTFFLSRDDLLDFTIRIGCIGNTPTFLYISKNTKYECSGALMPGSHAKNEENRK